jgi:hypothetical protein
MNGWMVSVLDCGPLGFAELVLIKKDIESQLASSGHQGNATGEGSETEANQH